MKNHVFHVTLFNEFTISSNEEKIIVSDYLGKQLVNLLQVLVYYHLHPIQNETLLEILWANNNNPKSALKIAVHRLRNELQTIPIFQGKDIIMTTKQGYQLNVEYTWNVDIEEFYALWNEIKFEDSLNEETLKKAYRMIQLYKGKFYISNSHLFWMIQISEYYRQAYVNCVIKICNYLMANQDYEEMLNLNYQAILLEPFYEGLHYYYMKGLLETCDYHKALTYYDDLNETFMKELGTGLTKRFKDLYDDVINANQEIDRKNISSLMQFLSTNVEEKGGFYCTIDMFKAMYELLIKQAKRDNKKLFLVSFEIRHEDGKDEEVYKVVNRVKKDISDSLRKNDLFTKINEGQFSMLLDCETLDNAYMIVHRITKRFYKTFRNRHLKLNYYVSEADLLKKQE